MESINLTLDPRVTTDESTAGHIVGLGKPGQVFVLERAEVRTMLLNGGNPSSHNFFILKQNPADYPTALDVASDNGIEEAVLTRTFSPLAFFSWVSDTGIPDDPGVKRYDDIDYPVVGGLLGLYGITGTGYTALQYMLTLKGHFRKLTRLEFVKEVIIRKRGWTEMVNHVSVNWDVHLPR